MPTSYKHKTSDVFVTGTGALLPSGRGISALWALAEKKQTFVADGLGALAEPPLDALKIIALPAALDAMTEAGWGELTARDGLILATTTGYSLQWEKDPQVGFSRLPLGVLVEELARDLNFAGRRQVVSTACAAGVHAIALASLWIKEGWVERCLVGGVETLCALTVNGFGCLQLLSKNQCKPFDAARSGINLGEGGAFLTLERTEMKAKARISGWGFSQDAYHMTAPHPEGTGSLAAMQRALTVAQLHERDISWVHAHGTGSLHNDASEAEAIRRLFGESAPPVTSTKGTHGHLLGATGVVETALIIESIQRERLLPTAGLENPDPKILLPLLQEAKDVKVAHVLKSVLGFGGANGALVVSAT